MDEEKMQWYYSGMGYEGKDGFVTEKFTYEKLPEEYDLEDAEDNFEYIWREKYPYKRRFSWEVKAVDKPPQEWLREQIDSKIQKIDHLKQQIDEYHKLLHNQENK